VDPWLVSYLWFLICTYAQPFPNGFKPVHLLWGLLFLHLYNSEPVNCTRVACDEKTFRKWAWFVVCALADLEPYVVSATTPWYKTVCLRFVHSLSFVVDTVYQQV
jgi:hypothetical protein